MSWIKKLVTAVRGGVNEAGEAVADSQAMRILDQEMRDAERELGLAKENLTSVMAEHVAVDRKVKQLKAQISEHEGYAAQALDSGKDELAHEIAEKIAFLDTELAAQTAVLESHNSTVSQIKVTIRDTEKALKGLKTEVAIEKTQASAHKAQKALAERHSGSNSAMLGAKSSLERIQARRQKEKDRMAAASELSKESDGADLNDKLRDAGIIPGQKSANDVLNRIRNKSAAS